MKNCSSSKNVEADQILDDAKEQARLIEIQVRDQALQVIQKAEGDIERRRSEINKEEDRLQKRVKLKKTRNADLEMGHARRELDWERQFAVAMNPPRARAIRDERMPADAEGCTMCGDYCAIKLVNRYFKF